MPRVPGKKVTLSIPVYYFELAQELAEEKHITYSEVLRQAIIAYMSAYERSKKVKEQK